MLVNVWREEYSFSRLPILLDLSYFNFDRIEILILSRKLVHHVSQQFVTAVAPSVFLIDRENRFYYILYIHLFVDVYGWEYEFLLLRMYRFLKMRLYVNAIRNYAFPLFPVSMWISSIDYVLSRNWFNLSFVYLFLFFESVSDRSVCVNFCGSVRE